MAGSASGRPRVILCAALSVDGRIATRAGDSRLSCPRDLDRLHRLRSGADAVIVGKNTVLADDPMLTVRRVRGGGNPARVVLDSRGAIPTESRILQTSGRIPTIIAASGRISGADVRRISAMRAEVVVAGERRVDLAALLGVLWDRGMRTVLVEGGGAVNWEFVRRGLFDELTVTLCPFLIGGRGGAGRGGAGPVPFLDGGDGFARVADSPRLDLKSVKRLENHLVLDYVRV